MSQTNPLTHFMQAYQPSLTREQRCGWTQMLAQPCTCGRPSLVPAPLRSWSKNDRSIGSRTSRKVRSWRGLGRALEGEVDDIVPRLVIGRLVGAIVKQDLDEVQSAQFGGHSERRLFLDVLCF